jgi:hypothetical protein
MEGLMKNQKRFTAAAFIAVFALLGGVIFGGTAVAKKKKKSKAVTVTKAVNAPIPDAIGNGVAKVQNGKLAVPITVSKKFKGTVGQTAVTFQTTGLAADAARNLFFKIIAPDGTTVGLGGAFNGQSIGPLTEQPNSSVGICSFDPTLPPPPPPCEDPDDTLLSPYVGIAGNNDLNLLNGVKGKGNWTFEAQDTGYAVPPATALTSILNTVTLKLTPQKPIT